MPLGTDWRGAAKDREQSARRRTGGYVRSGKDKLRLLAAFCRQFWELHVHALRNKK